MGDSDGPCAWGEQANRTLELDGCHSLGLGWAADAVAEASAECCPRSWREAAGCTGLQRSVCGRRVETQAVRGSGPDTEGDTQHSGAGMLTCVTDGCRARQVRKYESHPSTGLAASASAAQESCGGCASRYRAETSGNVKFDRRPRLVMSRSMTWPKPGPTRPTRTRLRGRRPNLRRWPSFRRKVTGVDDQ